MQSMSNEQLVVLIQDGIDEAENMSLLWQQNEGFIGKLALIYAGQAEMEDLKQEGYLALCEAVRGYDVTRGPLPKLCIVLAQDKDAPVC